MQAYFVSVLVSSDTLLYKGDFHCYSMFSKKDQSELRVQVLEEL